jgi:integrase
VYRRADRPGWRGEITWTDEVGRRHRRVVNAPTQQDARSKLDELRRDLRLGILESSSRSTVGEYLREWIERHRVKVRPSTWRTAEGYVRGYLVPALGKVPLAKLSSSDVEAALTSFVRSGRPQTGEQRPSRPVSAVTAAHIRATLRAALADASRAGLVGRNAAADAKPPRLEQRPVAYLRTDDLHRLLSTTADDLLGPMYALAAATGLRRGELVGLRWADISDGVLRVSRSVARDEAGGWSAAETKSVRSRRALPLPGLARNALDRQRKRQAGARLAAGSAWQDQLGLVFTDAVGKPILPEYVSHAFAAARKRAGLPTATLHQLRHTAATMLLAEGVSLAVISEWLGHSGIAVTMKHYAAVVPALHRQAADAMDRALRLEAG